MLDVAHTWPGIEKTPGVAGGVACVVRTRIPVWVLEGYRRAGWSEARLLENYPTLRAADLVNAWAYAEAHRDEIDQAIRGNAEARTVARLYADENLPLRVVQALRALGHDVLTARPGAISSLCRPAAPIASQR